MRLLQISPTTGTDCGIALFASNLAYNLRSVGLEVDAVERSDGFDTRPPFDLVLLQHHDELMSDEELRSLSGTIDIPLVLFAHSEGAGRLSGAVTGLAAMCPEMLGGASVPSHVFPHPAWTPTRLENRATLRREFGLPQDRFILGTNGFLKFERQLLEVADGLLAEPCYDNVSIEMLTSPWRLSSPGLVSKLQALQERNPGRFRFQYAFLDAETLNRRLQACDLLWCWTDAPSSPYASGVVSDQYASGTRMFIADKLQHHHVINFPNVVKGASDLHSFVAGLKEEIGRAFCQRHDPAPVAWTNIISDFAEFLQKMRGQSTSRI